MSVTHTFKCDCCGKTAKDVPSGMLPEGWFGLGGKEAPHFKEQLCSEACVLKVAAVYVEAGLKTDTQWSTPFEIKFYRQ
jgi:hypothetical protein